MNWGLTWDVPSAGVLCRVALNKVFKRAVLPCGHHQRAQPELFFEQHWSSYWNKQTLKCFATEEAGENMRHTGELKKMPQGAVTRKWLAKEANVSFWKSLCRQLLLLCSSPGASGKFWGTAVGAMGEMVIQRVAWPFVSITLIYYPENQGEGWQGGPFFMFLIKNKLFLNREVWNN